MTFKARISVPRTVSIGDLIEIKTLASHPMESGFRRDARGGVIPQDIITRFTVELDGELVFAADFGPGIAANPYLSFKHRVTRSGTLVFIWTEHNGTVHREQRTLQVQSE